ncbi:MAG: hypothetical protein HY976_03765 [Candidatus Kerfeldbacteria bacterium]|nr:hypothetical protein [Candidatus Kerfeldbacteria bacterium]
MRNPFSFLYPNARRRKRDYSAPATRTANPNYPPAPRGGFPWIAILIVLILSGGGAWLLTTPRYRISAVQIGGTEKLDRASIERFVNERLDQRLLGIPWRRVSLLTPVDKLSNEIQAAAGRLVPIAGVTVTKTDRVTLAIQITERVPNFLWAQADGRRFFIDDQGVILEPAPESLINDLPTIIDANNLPADPGERVVSSDVLTASRAVRDRLPTLNVTAAKFSTWPVSCEPVQPPTTPTTTNDNTNAPANVNVELDLSEPADCDPDALAISEGSFVVTTSEGWEIRFTAASAIETQLSKLATALRERLDNRAGLRYVDVRFGDRVFFQ